MFPRLPALTQALKVHFVFAEVLLFVLPQQTWAMLLKSCDSAPRKQPHFMAKQHLQAQLENQLPKLLLPHLPSCQAHS